MWFFVHAFQRRPRRRRRRNNEDDNDGCCRCSRSPRPVVRITTRTAKPNKGAPPCHRRHSVAQKKPEYSCRQINEPLSSSSSPPPPPPPPPPILFTLAKSWSWQAVNLRSETHPEEVASAYQDDEYGDGDTALHVAIMARRPPVSTVQILAPHCASICNHRGMYPLHAACSYRSPSDVLSVLLTAFPPAANLATYDGSYPIHIFCDYSAGDGDADSVECLRLLLRYTSARVLWKRDLLYRQRPLHILNARRNIYRGNDNLSRLRSLRIRQRQTKAVQQQDHQLASTWREYGDLQHELRQRFEEEIHDMARNDFLWKKSSLLLVAENDPASSQPMPSQSTTSSSSSSSELRRSRADGDRPTPQQILCAVLDHRDCPPNLQEYATLLYEPLLLEPIGSHGRLALHVFVLASKRHHDDNSVTNTDLLRQLLTACPEAAAVRDSCGKLPLDYEMENEDCSCWSEDRVKMLLEARPLAVWSTTRTTKAPASLSSSSSNNNRRLSQLFPHIFPRHLSISAIYTILRANPNLLISAPPEIRHN